jgi:serine O-acetyltransferase
MKQDNLPLSFRALLRADLERYMDSFKQRGQKANRWRIILESFIFKAGFQAVFLHRSAHWLHQRRLNRLAWIVVRMNQFLTSAEFEFNAIIGPGLMLPHPAGIVIGRGSVIGSRSTLYQGVTLGASDWHSDRITAFPKVGHAVFIYAGAKIIGDITIGNNVVIGANSVVLQDIPDNALAVGNPARIIPNRGLELVQASGVMPEPNEERL